MNNIATDGSFDWTKLRRVPPPTNNALLVEPGDILFNATNSPELVGKNAVFEQFSEPVTFSNHFFRLRVNARIADSRMLSRWLLQQWQRGAFKSMCRQWVNQASINKDQLLSLVVPLPPLDEQRRIAAILDQADDLRRKRREAIAKLAKLSTGLFVELFGTPWISSASSSISDLGSISVFENGDRSSNYPSGDDILTSGIPFLSTKNIVDDKLDLGSLLFISSSKFASLSRGKARPHDLIITLRGTLGSCCIFDGPFSTAFINAQMMIIRPKTDISPVFLHAYLTLPAIKEHLQQIGNGAAVPQLTAKQLAGLPILHPPLPLQRAFAARVAEIDKLKAHHRAHLARLDALFASLQHRAFRGELPAPSFSRSREKVASRSEVG